MKLKFCLSLIIGLFVCSSMIYSQQMNYPIEKINGKEYYRYKVQTSEGLYAISKKFGVTQAEINNLNPQIYDGLKAGQEILIPKTNAVKATPAAPQAVSNEIEYVLHTVERRQTLFAISRKYNVTQDVIIKANPNTANRGIQPGDVLRIPVKKGTAVSTESPGKPAEQVTQQQTQQAAQEQIQTVQPAEQTFHVGADGNYLTHKVQAKETLYAISKKYNVTQDAIIQANPAIKGRGLQVNEVLRIPLKKATTATQTKPATQTQTSQEKVQAKEEDKPSFFEKLKEKILPKSKSDDEDKNKAEEQKVEKPSKEVKEDDENFIKHQVEAKETLYAISRKYNVSVSEIKAANPELTDVLKAGTILRIPRKSGAEVATSKPTSTPATPTKPAVVAPKVTEKSTYKVAYLLPFMLNSSSKDATIDKFLEFYMGSLLAINNAKNGDMNFEIYTYDIEKTETKVYEVINKPEMQDMDLIIGPAYTAQIPVLTDFALRHKIHTVIPFSSKVGHINNNPYVFQFNPDQETQIDFFANTLRTRFANSNIIFVETGSNRMSDDGIDIFNVLTSRLNKQKIAYKKIKASEMNNIESNLSTSTNNIIIFDTEDFSQVQSHLSKLHDLSSNYNLGVVGQYSWRSTSGKKPKMYYVSPFMGNSTATDFYEAEFKKYYGNMKTTSNPRFDLLGYDLTSYFLGTMKKNGFTFNNSSLSLRFTNGVQSDFNFQRAGNNGGFVNQNLYLIEDAAKTK